MLKFELALIIFEAGVKINVLGHSIKLICVFLLSWFLIEQEEKTKRDDINNINNLYIMIDDINKLT